MTSRVRLWTGALLAACMVTLAACDSAEERAQKHFERGMELLEQGEAKKAQLEFRNVIRLDDRNVEARYQYARILHDQKDLRGAVGQYLAVLELKPDYFEARVSLAEIYLIAGRQEAVLEAEKQIDEALRIRSDDGEAQAIKATVDYKLGNVDKAVDLAGQVLEADPANVTARLVLIARQLDSKQNAEAFEEVETGLGHDPENLSLNVIKLGLLERLDRDDEVGAQLARMVDVFPDNLKFRETYARWLNSNDDPAGAEAQLREIAARRPNDPDAALQVVRFIGATRGADAARKELTAMVEAPDSKIEYELALASLDYSEGKPDDAAGRLQKIIDREGENAEGDKARIELARVHLREKRPEAANALVDEVLAHDPKNEAALTLRGARYIDEDKPEEAIRDLRAALDADPGNVLVLMKLAQAYERNGSRELALERLAQATQASSYRPEVARRYARTLIDAGKTDIAENVLLESLSRNPQDRDLTIALAGIRLDKRNFVSALQIADALMKADPNDEVAARIRAAAYAGQKRYDESIAVLSAAAERDGDGDAATMISLVRTYLSAGDPEKAEQYLNEVIERDPGNAEARILLGSVHSAQGNSEEAEAAFRAAIEVDPTSADAYASLARLYRTVGRIEDADQVIRQGLDAATGNDEMLRLSLAMRHEQEGRFDEALKEYGILYERNPESIVVANNYASLLAEHRADDQEQLERAFAIAKRFRDTKQPYLQDTYGWLLHLRGDDERAMASLKEAAEALPGNAQVQYHAGVVYAALGQTQQARAHLQRAIELADLRPFAKVAEAKQALEALPAQSENQ
jgi:cellulose synthase operon protein C